MWKNDRWKVVVLNIFLALLIIAILGALLYTMLRVRQDTQKYDEQLGELYVQQQQQQTEARQESVENIQAEYQKDMDTVANYLPGIVCWGDTLTQGTSGNISYPSVLQTYLDTYFCDIYDFRSTIPNADEFARLNWDNYKVSIPVVNMGCAQESTYTVLGRCGAVPYVLSADVLIPAGCERVEVRLVSDSGRKVGPLVGGGNGINNVFIGDIEGTLSIDATSQRLGVYQYYFTRLEPGEETAVNAGTVVKTAASDLYRDYIHIVWIGTYGSFTSANDLVNQVKALLARQEVNPERFLVIGVFGQNGQVYSSAYMDAIDTAMMQAFGNRYVNVRKYLMGDGLADAGIEPTKKDIYNINDKRIPDSFKISSDGVELTGKAYTLIGKLIYDRMESLGYFDEVFDELSIRETMKQILKDDPGYFDRILASRLK